MKNWRMTSLCTLLEPEDRSTRFHRNGRNSWPIDSLTFQTFKRYISLIDSDLNYKPFSLQFIYRQSVLFSHMSLDLAVCMYVYIYIYTYTGCPRRNVPDFGRVFLMLKYTDIAQNTYVQSWTVTEIVAKEKCGLLAVPVSWQHYPCPSLNVVSYYGNSAQARSKLLMYFLLGDKVVHVSAWHSCHV